MLQSQEIRQLARNTAMQAAKDAEHWMAFLRCAAYMYNYSFANQLLIFAQRPDATACASMEYWNSKALHWVRRGSKSIALLDTHGSRSGLKLVFDFSDTYPLGYAPEFLPWMLDNGNRAAAYRVVFGETMPGKVQEAIGFRAASLAAERQAMLEQALTRSVEGSALEWADSKTRMQVLHRLIQASVTYMACVRCGEPVDQMDTRLFADVSQFDTLPTIICLGSAVREINKELISEIGSAVRQLDSVAQPQKIVDTSRDHQYKKEVTNHELLDARNGIPGSGTDAGRTADAPAEQVRQPAAGVPAPERPGTVRGDDPDGQPVRPSAGDGRSGAAGGERNHEPSAERTAQPLRPQEPASGVGRVDEQSETAGRGTGRPDAVRPVTEQPIPQAESEKTSPSAFFIGKSEQLPPFPPELLPQMLRTEDSSRGSNAEILDYFSQHPLLIDRIRFIKERYHPIIVEMLGKDGRLMGFYAQPQGLLAWEGRFPSRTSDSLLTWHAVVRELDALAETGQLVAKSPAPQTPPQREQQTPQEEMQLSFDSYTQIPAGAGPLGLRSEEEQQQTLLDAAQEITGAEAAAVKILMNPPPLEDDGTHINEAEINHALVGGNFVSESKLRIFHQFEKQEGRKANADFLKHCYGTGGCSWTFLDGAGGWVDYESKQFKITYGNYGSASRYEKILRWTEVEQRIRYLIGCGQYLNRAETEYYPEWSAVYDLRRKQPGLYQTVSEAASRLLHYEVSIAELLSEQDAAEIGRNTSKLTCRVFLRALEDRTLLARVADQLDGFTDENEWAEAERIRVVGILRRYAKGEEIESTAIERAAANARPYAVGDRIYLEGKPYTIEQIGGADLQLRDENFPLIGRAVSREDFDRHLRRDVRNAGLIPPAQESQQPAKTPETAQTGITGPETAECIGPPVPGQLAEDDSFVEQVLKDVERIAAAEPPRASNLINYEAPYAGTAPTGPKAWCAANIKAIETLQAIEKRTAAGGEPANAEEQKVLAAYSGWGGLSQAFDPSASGWSGEYDRLKGLLNEQEYAAARSTVLSAYYTPPAVVHTIYRTLERFGVTGGNVLEPSMGTGAFFAHKPSSFAQHDAKLYGVELDSLTGRTSKQLYQKAKIQIAGYETARLPDNFFDCVVGNVPFGDYSVSGPAYDRLHFKIHDYFLAKSIDKLRTGGIMAVVTTSGTMDKKIEEVRKHIAARCDLIGAVRLPNNAFSGTRVMADILFLQKRDAVANRDEPWLHLGQTADGIPLNQYFLDHPEMVCGEMKMASGPHGPTPTCVAFETEEEHDHYGRPALELQLEKPCRICRQPSPRRKPFWRKKSRMPGSSGCSAS